MLFEVLACFMLLRLDSRSALAEKRASRVFGAAPYGSNYLTGYFYVSLTGGLVGGGPSSGTGPSSVSPGCCVRLDPANFLLIQAPKRLTILLVDTRSFSLRFS